MEPIILMTGLNHTTAPVAVRECLAGALCTREQAHAGLLAALDPSLFSERLLLSTCNRTEIYAVASAHADGELALRRAFASQNVWDSAWDRCCYTYGGRAAVAHLFSVASGIDSMIVGEFEILGQVRRAYEQAVEDHTLGPLLHQLFQHAVNTGKRARAETAIGQGALSVAYAAVELARRELGELRGRTALVIGAGDMGRRAAKNLQADGACTVVVASRTYARALELADSINGAAIPFDDMPAALTQADLVISATRAPHLILEADQVAEAMRTRPDRPLCIVDIAVPRDIDPAADQLANVRLFNIDDLEGLVATNRAARDQAAAEVRRIVEEEVEAYWQWLMARRAAPLIGELYAHAEAIRQAELDKALRRLSHLDLSERERNVIAALSAGLVGKLLAAPTARLKEQVLSGDGQVYLDTVRDLFQLDEFK